MAYNALTQQKEQRSPITDIDTDGGLYEETASYRKMASQRGIIFMYVRKNINEPTENNEINHIKSINHFMIKSNLR